ncbi:hypothetical protein L2Y96_19410 [Luteibacter aegosomaticola]|uniref:hypothetical protein n=1 Tax=Luteibacter aegosomaticola TaxID=2911538 RepID=UPI001FFB8557|nr:hypothetical protein [Luteibacter aegosomaticola]UPG89542.1 hypothetical protein L2Y96_19410 [Luteibacter aegosomaticola]
MITVKDEMLVSPSVHDGSLMGILLEKPDRVRLVVELVTGESVSLVMDGVRRMKADDFRGGNIILSVSVTSGSDLSIADIADAYGMSHDNTTYLPRALEEHRAAGLTVVRVDPSYGCTLVCLCNALSMEAARSTVP